MISKEDIRKFLDQSGMSREEFAKSIGTFKGTVDGWLSPQSKREIPLPTLLLIEYLYFRTEPSFNLDISFEDFDKLRAKISRSGKTPGQFIVEALKDFLSKPELPDRQTDTQELQKPPHPQHQPKPPQTGAA